MFFKNLENLCQQKNTSVTAVAIELGISKGSVTNWKKGVIPKGDTILRVARHFNVSTDYLLTGENKYENLSNEEEQWISLFHQLSPEGRIACQGYAAGYIDAQSEDL